MNADNHSSNAELVRKAIAESIETEDLVTIYVPNVERADSIRAELFEASEGVEDGAYWGWDLDVWGWEAKWRVQVVTE